jgi:hypothetical protein
MKHLAARRKRVFAKFDDAEFDDAEHAFGNGDGKANGAGVIVAPFGKGGGGGAGGGGQDLVGGGLRRFGSLGQAASGMLRSSGSLKMQARLPARMKGAWGERQWARLRGAASARCFRVLVAARVAMHRDSHWLAIAAWQPPQTLPGGCMPRQCKTAQERPRPEYAPHVLRSFRGHATCLEA